MSEDVLQKQARLGDAYKPFRWSFSQWENYQGCPARWKFKSVLKIPGKPPGGAAARGLEMHDRVEKYVTGMTDDVDPPEGVTWQNDKGETLRPAIIQPEYIPVLDSFRNHTGYFREAEYKIGMDEDFGLCAPRSAMSSCMAVLDVIKAKDGIVEVGEWKSGKPKDTHADQRKLYALVAMKSKLADEVRVTTYYLEGTAKPERLVVKASAQEKLQALWRGRVEEMQKNTICAPRPGFYCRWCDYANSKGGPCHFS